MAISNLARGCFFVFAACLCFQKRLRLCRLLAAKTKHGGGALPGALFGGFFKKNAYISKKCYQKVDENTP